MDGKKKPVGGVFVWEAQGDEGDEPTAGAFKEMVPEGGRVGGK